jgi:uncharacterized protein YecT (DUF1311 family)
LLALTLAAVAGPAFAIDCNRAASETEKAICGNAEARAADQELGKAFDRLRGLLPDDERGDLRLSQIEWIGTRDASCLAQRATKPLSQCLVEQSKWRQHFLEGKRPVGATAGLFRPVFIFRPASKQTARLEIEAIRLTGEGSGQANAAIDKLVKRAIEDSQLDGTPHPGGSLEVGLDVSLAFASPRLLSVHAEYGNYYPAPAHPLHDLTNINVEVPTGRELKFADVVDTGKAKKLFQYCQAQIVKEKEKVIGADIHGGSDDTDDIDLKEVAEGTEQFSNWKFIATGVEIYYGDYAFGGYGKCMCSCKVPYSALRPWANKDFSLPAN